MSNHIKQDWSVKSRGKLSPKTIIAIRQEYFEGAKQNAIAKKYGVWASMVNSIIHGLKYNYIPGNPNVPTTKNKE